VTFLGDEPQVIIDVLKLNVDHLGDAPSSSIAHDSRPFPCLER
jgi:hypothetical protein